MALEAHYVPGRLAVAYYTLDRNVFPIVNDSATVNSRLKLGTTAEVDNMTDVNYDVGSEMADVTTRGTAKNGFSSEVAVLKNGQITFDMIWLPSDVQVTPDATAPTGFTAQVMWCWIRVLPIPMTFSDAPYEVSTAANQGAGSTEQEILRSLGAVRCRCSFLRL